MVKIRSIAYTVVLGLALAGCSSENTTFVTPELETYLARVTVDGQPADYYEGSPPAPGSGPSANMPTSSVVITGGSVQVDMTASGEFATVVIVVDGIEGYFMATVPSSRAAARLVVTLAGLVPELQFDYLVAVADGGGQFGPYSRTTMEAIPVASGDIQVSATWDTEADVDLHVVGPDGNEIYYGNRSASGGQLDLDANAACSTSNIYQENIGWAKGAAPRGTYTVRLDYWSSCGVDITNYVVTVSLRPGTPVIPGTPGAEVLTYTGSFTGDGTNGGAGDGRFITRFTF